MKLRRNLLLSSALAFAFLNTVWLMIAFWLNWFPQPLESNFVIRAIEILWAVMELFLLTYLAKWVYKQLPN